MKKNTPKFALLYTALAVGAIYLGVSYFNTTPPNQSTPSVDTTALAALRDGDMKKLNFHDTPQTVSQNTFTDEDGGEHKLSDWQGKIVLLNFWATWCAPCREEMPSLDALQKDLGGADFEVVTLATGRNTLPGIKRFFADEGVTSLPILLDPKQAVAREMAVLGLPITVILDRQGREIARLTGDAEWNSNSARAIIAALTEG